MSGPGPRMLNFGTVPERRYLDIIVRFEGLPKGVTSVDELDRELRKLRDAGRWSELRAALVRLGVEWRDPEACA